MIGETIKINASNYKATIGGTEYHWCGGFGAVLKSFERGVNKGDARVIGNVMFWAFMVEHHWFRPSEIAWTTQHEIDAEWIRCFKSAMFR